MEELIIDVGSLTNEELLELDEFLTQQGEITLNDLANEIKKFADENFDPYTFLNQRKIRKANAKYVSTIDAINFWSEKVEREIEYRKSSGKIKEETVSDNMSVDEFIINERKKNEKFKDRK